MLQTGLPDDYSRLAFPVNVVLLFITSSLDTLTMLLFEGYSVGLAFGVFLE